LHWQFSISFSVAYLKASFTDAFLYNSRCLCLIPVCFTSDSRCGNSRVDSERLSSLFFGKTLVIPMILIPLLSENAIRIFVEFVCEYPLKYWPPTSPKRITALQIDHLC